MKNDSAKFVNSMNLLDTDITVRDMSENGNRIRYSFTSKHGENIDVEFGVCECNSSLFETWKEHRWIPKTQKSWFNVDVQAIDSDGNCWGKYNPQVNKQHKLDFDWVLEDNEENRKKILCEIIRRANETPVVISIS